MATGKGLDFGLDQINLTRLLIFKTMEEEVIQFYGLFRLVLVINVNGKTTLKKTLAIYFVSVKLMQDTYLLAWVYKTQFVAAVVVGGGASKEGNKWSQSLKNGIEKNIKI